MSIVIGNGYNDEIEDNDYYDDEWEPEDEELVDEEEKELFEDESDDGDYVDDDWDEDEEKRIDRSFACEDCDYRWDDPIVKRKDDLEEEEFDDSMVCPMCGSRNLTQI